MDYIDRALNDLPITPEQQRKLVNRINNHRLHCTEDNGCRTKGGFIQYWISKTGQPFTFKVGDKIVVINGPWEGSTVISSPNSN